VVLEKLLEPHPELPLTLALVTGDFDPSLGGLFAQTGREIAAAALRLPNVEPASRTRTMPLRWSFFERYMRDAEMDAVERLVSGAPIRDRGLLPVAFSNLSEVFVKDRGRLTFERGSALRRYVAEPFALNAEIGGSLLEAAELAGTDAPIRLITWGGDAQVFEAALASARSSGATAMGGEGGLYDAVAPSVSNLSALSVQVGAERQIYDALHGDAVLTNYWTSPIHGLLRLERVIDATERPRRLKPVQLSFSAYSALRYGSLTAARTLLDRLSAMELAPVYAADYARMVEGFSTMRSIPVGPLQWRIEDRGALQTLRFDAPAGRDLDPARCSGVIGRRIANGSLYVALDPAAEQPVVALSLTAGGADKQPEAGRFLLDNARWRVSALEADSCSATFDAAGFGVGDMTWQAPASGTYRVELYRSGSGADDAPLFWDDVAVDEGRRLVLALPAMEDGAARVRFSGCR
jgi:hypothetical protein